jgi:L-cystine uptake protein TcyP (sodium:dicarboxylate symporter family)
MISKINPMISKINPRFIVNMMSIIVVSVAGIATIGSVHAE